MTNITVISCIIAAVCVFQGAEGELFDKSLVNYVMGNIQHEVLSNLENVRKLKYEIQSHDSGVEGLTDEVTILPTIQKELLNSMECSNAFNESQKMFLQVIESINSCITNITNSPVFHKFTVAINKLEAELSMDIQDGLKCIRNTPSILCLNNGLQNISKLIPLIEKLWMYIEKIIHNIRECLMIDINKLFHAIANEVEQCIRSIL